MVDVLPVDPGDVVVLAVGVVVSALGARELVAGQQHRAALRQEDGGQQVALLARAQHLHLGIAAVALDAAVPGSVVIGAVPVLLAVGEVVLLVVGDEVAEREAVMAGDEVDARPRPAPIGLVEVAGAGQPVGEVADAGGLRAPVVPGGVAELAVPLRPADREVADLVAAWADVPRLGDQLDVIAQTALDSVKTKLPEEQTGVNILRRALEEPLRQIAANAGYDGPVVIANVREQPFGYGFDAMTGQYVDMFKAGIIDPVKVTRTALQNAVSIAGMLLTTDTIITDAPVYIPDFKDIDFGL